MSVSQINLFRVSTNMRTLSLLDSLRRNTLDLFLEQNRVATGERFSDLSEDPVSAMEAVRLTQVIERQEQVAKNLQHANNHLGATDTAIGEVNDLLIQAHGIASEMVNSTTGQAMRDASAELILGIINELVLVGNRTFQGVYLFGGQQTTRPPFTQDHGGVEYRGDTGALTARVSETTDAEYNLTGAELFGALSSEVAGYVDLDPALTADTRLADLNGAVGTGVHPGLVAVSLDNPPAAFVVDLRSADTVGDVVDMMNAAAAAAGLTVGPGGQFNAAINTGLDGLDLTVGAGTITVAEVGGASTARELGILGTGAGAIHGGDLDPRLTDMTRIDSLFSGTGPVLGSIQIDNGPLSETIDLSTVATVQELLGRLTHAGLEIRASINDAGTGINVVSAMSGAELRISETGDGTTELLGIRSLYAQTPLATLNNGRGVQTREGLADLRVVAKDGSNVDVNLDGARTIQDVLDAINAAAAAAGVAVSATVALTGNGIRLVDATGGGGLLHVERLNASAAIDHLGLNKSAANPGDTELVGDDVNGIKPDSVFSALIDLHAALVTPAASKEQAITMAGERIRAFIDQANRLQGIVGARSQEMDHRVQLTEDAVVATRSLLSETKDLDYTEAITRFQQVQTTLQANLMTGSRLLQLSLLDFI